MHQGYFRHPTIHHDQVIFVAEDDLWSVNAAGGIPWRLTSNLGEIEFPLISPQGDKVAFIARDEGVPDVHVMDTGGGSVQRLTYQGCNLRTVAWSRDSRWIYYVTSAEQPTRGALVLNRVQWADGHQQVERVELGRADAIGFGPDGGTVLGRNTGDPARWKRYLGGTAGQLWLSPTANAPFTPLLPDLPGNLAAPMWLSTSASNRIFFLSDHEGIGNLYSSLPDGTDLTRHTHHTEFYARFASWGPTAEGSARIVYHAGADLYCLDLDRNISEPIPVAYASPGVQRNRKFVSAAAYLEQATLHPEGHSLALTTRGKAFVLGNHEGPVLQLGQRDGIRYRHAAWLQDGQQRVAVTDALGEERLIVFPSAASRQDATIHADFDCGRVHNLYPSPVAACVALVNHRSELWIYDLESQQATRVDRSPHGQIEHVAWSPDGLWLAYEYQATLYTTGLRLYRREQPTPEEGAANAEAAVIDLTTPVLHDKYPVFDPKGRYLYFLGHRIFNPTYDTLQFDLAFSRGVRPYLVTLQADLPNPFRPRPGEADEDEDDAEQAADKAAPDQEADGEDTDKDRENGKADKDKAPQPIRIDLDGIQDRILPFPVPESLFVALGAVEDRVIWLEEQARPSLPDAFVPSGHEGGTLQAWIFAQYKREDIADQVAWFSLSANSKKLLWATAEPGLRVVSAKATADSLTNEGPGRATGWIDLNRVKVSIAPQAEWQQMFKEAWRLQRDQFWTPDMSGVDWQAVFDRYFPLVERVGSRQEFSDLMWEMQGELGTSHAYELGGDYRPRPHYPLGSLGATFQWQEEQQGYEVVDWIAGDVWEPGVHSPLGEPGVDVARGDILIGINGQPLSRTVTPSALLVNLANQEVQLTFLPRLPAPDACTAETTEAGADDEVRHCLVHTLGSDTRAHYRAWVNRNRAWVHEHSEGRIGYLHIPDMGPVGFAEFHRGFLGEIHREGLVVDLRFNGGGHVSELLLEKLLRKRVGFDLSRWNGVMPYPSESIAGPIVALTNEAAGSDGDIFSHCFKLMGLGPLVGKRTWGGVIGIWPRHALVDGTVTTQPEYSFWFRDVGWKVENYGTDPDIEVEITPDDYRLDRDPQLARAVTESLTLLAQNPPLQPDWDERPDLSLPSLLAPRGPVA